MKNQPHLLLILILGALAAIGPFSIDMYLPAFPAISEDLKTDIAHVGFSLTSFFIGISLGQLLYGPVLDRYGRKKPMMAGLTIYIIFAIGCALSPSIEWLIINRFLLALGGCVGMVGGRAVVRDLFPLNETARVFSVLMLFMGVAPIIAPTIGGLIVSALGWRWIFGLLSLIAGGVLATIAFLIPESKAADPSISIKPHGVIREYVAILKEPVFITYAVASGANSGALFAYISGGPFVFMKLLGFSAREYGWLFGINAVGLVAGSQVNRYLLKKHASATIAFLMTVFQFGAGILLFGGTLLGVLHTGPTLGVVWGFIFFLGFLNPNTTALALGPFTKNVGSASALLGSAQMIVGALASALISLLHNGTALPMTGVMMLCSLISLGFLWVKRYSGKKAMVRVQ